MRFPESLAVLAVVSWTAACTSPRAPAPAPAKTQPALVLRGTFSDGTPLDLAALKGRPWVINVWLPG